MTASRQWRQSVNALSGIDPPVLLVEITHDQLPTPIRIAQDSDDLYHQGNRFIALAFRGQLPEDIEQGRPRAQLQIDNVSLPPEENSIGEWLELSNGGRGALLRLILVRRSLPDVVEWESVLTCSDVHVDPQFITATLIYADLGQRSAVALQYRPHVAPGIF